MTAVNFLFEITVYSGVIFITTMLLKACFKSKMSPLLHYAIWLVLVLRLTLPVTVASPVHIFVIPAEPQSQTGEEDKLDFYQPTASSYINIADTATAQPQTEAASDMPNETQATSVAALTPFSFNLPQIVTLVWISGAGVCLTYLVILYISLRRKLSRNASRPSKSLMDLFNEAKAKMGIKANVKLICQYGYGTPSLMFPGTILMPADALVAMNEEQTLFALRHELMHFKRGDHIASILLSLLNAVYWFNPFVWIAFSQMRKDMETACDGAVVKYFSAAARSRYASLILSLSAKPAHRQLILGMSRSGARKAAEQRVKGIFMKGESKMSIKLITILLAITLIFTCFTTSCQPVTDNTALVNNNPEMTDENIGEDASSTPSPDIRENINASYLAVPCDFTQPEVDTILKYFLNDSPLYTAEYIKSKSMIMDEIAQMQAELAAMDGSNPDDIEGAKYAISKLKAAYPSAPETVVRTQITSKLTVPLDADYEILFATADLGYIEFSNIDVSNRPGHQYMSVVLDRSRYFLQGFLPSDKDTKILNMTPEEAKQKAEEALIEMGIEDMAAVKVDARMTEDRSKQGYIVTFHRSVNGTPVAYDERAAMDPKKWAGDEIKIRIDDKGISAFEWHDKGKLQE